MDKLLLSDSSSRTRNLGHICLHVCQNRWKKVLDILLLVTTEDLKPMVLKRRPVKITGKPFKRNRTEVEKSSLEIVLRWKKIYAILLSERSEEPKNMCNILFV